MISIKSHKMLSFSQYLVPVTALLGKHLLVKKTAYAGLVEAQMNTCVFSFEICHIVHDIIFES